MNQINLEDAIKLVGVSEKTFKRFLSAGYFSPQLIDGNELFSVEEISKVFGIPLPKIEIKAEKSEAKKPTEHLVFPEINAMANLSTEIEKLKNIIALQEQILDLKEREIADLREQRSWLQERYSKMEEKSERDQLLLISETQMLTKIIANQNKKTTWEKALNWLGLEDSSKSSN